MLMSNGLSQALQLIAGLSILVTLHEFGHFFFARRFKTKVEKFYLFFDFFFPFSNIFNFALFKKKIGDTEYGIGWFPFGGYVKIAGMVDESMDKEALAKPPEPWEFRSKKPYERLLIMLGGIIMNVLVAIFIYAIAFGVWGESFLPLKAATYGISVDSTGESIGLKNGDFIKDVDGEPVTRFNDVIIKIVLHKEDGTIGLVRDGKDTSIHIPFGTIQKISKAGKSSRAYIISPRIPAVVDSVAPGSAASKVGLQRGDSFVSINGMPAGFYDQFEKLKKENYEQAMHIVFLRHGLLDSATVTLARDSALGFHNYSYNRYFTPEVVKYNPIQAVGKGFSYAYDRFVFYVAQFKLMGSKEVKVSDSLGGFGTLASMYTPVFDLHDFLMWTAFISIALAFMNLLPIPGLDGGYVFFLLFEMVTGKKVSDKVMEITTTVGLVLLVGLLLYSNYLDVIRHFFNK